MSAHLLGLVAAGAVVLWAIVGMPYCCFKYAEDYERRVQEWAKGDGKKLPPLW